MSVHTPPTQLHRWSRHAVDGLFCSLLAVHGLLLLSHRYDWFRINDYVGRAMLIDLAATVITILLALICLACAVTVRHPFQFTLRSLLLLIVSVAITSTWFGVEWKRERNEYELGVAIQQAGGRAGGPHTLLSRLLGDDHLVVLQNVIFDSGYKLPVTDADLLRLRPLRQLVILNVTQGEVTDSGLELLREHRYLKELKVHSKKVTDAGVVHLASLSELKYLSLEGTLVTDAGLKHLQGLYKLNYLYLQHTQISDNGLTFIPNPKGLDRLDISHTNVSRDGVREFRRVAPQCEIIWSGVVPAPTDPGGRRVLGPELRVTGMASESNGTVVWSVDVRARSPLTRP